MLSAAENVGVPLRIAATDEISPALQHQISAVPGVVAAAIGGVACAWLLAPLVGPSLNLAAFSGTGSAIVVTPAVFPLAASAAGLVLAALLVLASSAVITYYRGSARALRIAD